jgi:hypothetical protein
MTTELVFIDVNVVVFIDVNVEDCEEYQSDEGNPCLLCGVEMGVYNMRQLCSKTACPLKVYTPNTQRYDGLENFQTILKLK